MHLIWSRHHFEFTFVNWHKTLKQKWVESRTNVGTRLYDKCTLRTDINVRSGINVRAGKFGKNNKRTVWNKRTGGKIL